MKKIINKHGEQKVNRILLKIGLFLVFVGILVVLIGYLTNYTTYESFENGYHYRDEVAIIATVFIMNGLVLIVWLVGNKLKKVSYEMGYTVESQ